MAITPWYVGDRFPAWTISLVTDSGTINVSGLTSASFALRIDNTDANPPASATGTGSFSNLTAGSGSIPASILYELSAADVAVPGNYAVFVIVTFSTGEQETLSLGAWQVVPR